MVNWQRLLARTASSVEERLDTIRHRLGATLGTMGNYVIVPYLGYGSRRRLHLRGRVLEDLSVQKAQDGDHVWDNILNMYRRMESEEVPDARLRAQFAGMQAEVTTDSEGYFEIAFDPRWEDYPDTLWHQVELQLLAPLAEGVSPPHATGHVLIPPHQARFGVISDIDDTVIRTYATEWLRMARMVLLGNARTRLPFSGVSGFYRALQGGTGVQGQNPLFYVSSSPWNLYDLLVDFFQIQQIPLGPIFLRDWGVTSTELLPTDHHDHKLDAICTLLDFYGDLPFILIGDSGQQDPEIYSAVVQRYPGRISAVYIRDVSDDPGRDEAIRQLKQKLVDAGSDLVLAEDTMAMARHATEQGWMAPELLEDVEIAVARNEEAPTPAEVLLEDDE